MPPQRQHPRPCQEDRIQLALQALQNDASLSMRRAAKDFDVPKSTLNTQRQGTRSLRDKRLPARKLLLSEEHAITKYILELDERGFPPKHFMCQDMASKLLAERQEHPVGKNWPSSFVQRNSELQTRWTRALDRQRNLNRDPKKIKSWFTIQQYGITNQDIYNFDETGFAMGQISSHRVITSIHRHSKAPLEQPGNRQWTTVIQGVNGSVWTLPLYIIFNAKQHQLSWYIDADLPQD